MSERIRESSRNAAFVAALAAMVVCVCAFVTPASADDPCECRWSFHSPIQGLKQCTVEGDEQPAIDAALAACQACGGCNLYFPAGTYGDDGGVSIDVDDRFPDGFAMHGELDREGAPTATLLAPIYRFEDGGFYDHMIEIEATAPGDVIIEDLVLDGRKADQVPRRCCQGGGQDPECQQAWKDELNLVWLIQVQGDSSGQTSGGAIRNLVMRNGISGAVSLLDVRDWSVEHNTIHDIGCDTAISPCGWGEGVCDIDDVPNRQTNGGGVCVWYSSREVSVSHNTVDRVTKVGLDTFAAGGRGCEPGAPTDITFHANEVRHCATGLYINGGCEVSFTNNLAEQNSREGFLCADGGEGSQWLGNVSRDNGGPGYKMGCAQGGLLFEGNTAEENCLLGACQGHADNPCHEDADCPFGSVCQWTSHDGDFNFISNYRVCSGDLVTRCRKPEDCQPDNGTCDATPIDGLDITASATDSPKCRYGVKLIRYGDVRVGGGSTIVGRRSGGFYVDHGEGINIESTTVTQGATGGETGIQVEQEAIDVYVQATTEIDEDFDYPFGGSGSVTDCTAGGVPPVPQCCKNLTGYDEQDCSFVPISPCPIEVPCVSQGCTLSPMCDFDDLEVTVCQEDESLYRCDGDSETIHTKTCVCTCPPGQICGLCAANGRDLECETSAP